MTFEDFWSLPHELGWKFEYFDGEAHLSPKCHHCVAHLRLGEFVASISSAAVDVRKLALDRDRETLIELYCAAFDDSIDFCDCSKDLIAKNANNDIGCFLNQRRGPINSATRLAWDSRGQLAGGILVADTEPPRFEVDDVDGPEQLLVMVRPDRARTGVGLAMLSAVVADLRKQKHELLRSAYTVGNSGSRSWHHAMGFEDRPNWLLLGHYVQHERWELDRLKAADALSVEDEKLRRDKIRDLEITSENLQERSFENYTESSLASSA